MDQVAGAPAVAAPAAEFGYTCPVDSGHERLLVLAVQAGWVAFSEFQPVTRFGIADSAGNVVTLLEIARRYTDLVLMDTEIPETEYIAKDEVGALRSKYHQLFMDRMREKGVEYSDRCDANNRAFELVRNADPPPR